MSGHVVCCKLGKLYAMPKITNPIDMLLPKKAETFPYLLCLLGYTYTDYNYKPRDPHRNIYP